MAVILYNSLLRLFKQTGIVCLCAFVFNSIDLLSQEQGVEPIGSSLNVSEKLRPRIYGRWDSTGSHKFPIFGLEAQVGWRRYDVSSRHDSDGNKERRV